MHNIATGCPLWGMGLAINIFNQGQGVIANTIHCG